MFLGVGVMQLDAVRTGAYDPIRDDGWPEGSMPTYFANMRRTMAFSAVTAIVASLVAIQLWPRGRFKHSRPLDAQ
jgi:hypothetical protein